MPNFSNTTRLGSNGPTAFRVCAHFINTRFSLQTLRISHPSDFLSRRLPSAACSSSCLAVRPTPATLSTSLGTNRCLHLTHSQAASLSIAPYSQHSPCFLSTTPPPRLFYSISGNSSRRERRASNIPSLSLSLSLFVCVAPVCLHPWTSHCSGAPCAAQGHMVF
jgi:hypothetical protein